MGAGIAANPHCPSYRRRRVARRLPLGGSGRGRVEPRAVPRSAPSALARGESLSGSRTKPFGLASIPSGFRRTQAPIRSPAVPAGDRSPRAGSVRLGHRGEPLSLRHRLPIEASFNLPPRTSTRRTSSPPARLSLRSKLLRFHLPVPPRGEPRIGPGPDLDRSKLRSRSSRLRFRGAIPASVPAVAASWPEGFRCCRPASRNPAAHPLSLMLARLHPPTRLRRSALSF